jgi:hypothetical protein
MHEAAKSSNQSIRISNMFKMTPKLALWLATAAALMVTTATAEDCILVTPDTTDATYFCFDLVPKPSADTEVTCVAVTSDSGNTCCNGGNGWTFKPATDDKCGGLMSVPTANSPATVTCTAAGYTDGVLVMGPADAEPSTCGAATDAPITTDAPTAAPTDAPTAAPTSDASGSMLSKTSSFLIIIIAVVLLFAV